MSVLIRKRLLLLRIGRQLHPHFLLKWLLISGLTGSLVGSASALFLIALNSITAFRGQQPWLIYGLPLGGLIVVALYHYFGESVVKGNNQLIEEIEKPQNVIPLRMAPLVVAGTLLTHLFGGSAGREGTAVQMGGAIADQFTKRFRFRKRDRSQLIMCGISAGFAAVFGTPLAGAAFALEVAAIGRLKYEALIPSLLSALIANYICELFPVQHTAYAMGLVPAFSLDTGGAACIAGILFGLAARLFSLTLEGGTQLQKSLFKNPFIRVLAGGTLILILFLLAGPEQYAGLGIPVIVAAFTVQQLWYVFLLKILFTVLTLSCGFKGGEVTPLFFIGATLGSALSLVLPLPVGLLAGMGFVAVFCGAANTPVACILMGMELFGVSGGLYIAIACSMAYLFSGHKGIYAAQQVARVKHPFYRQKP